MRYRVVDVFSEHPLAGNALCVVLDPCPEEQMPAVAREVNLSETTFPTVTSPTSYRNRIFTPSRELPFAGHPSLGTAWVLGPGSWTQTTSGAVATIRVDATRAEMTQPDPQFADADPDGVAAAVGVGGVDAAFIAEAAGNRFLIAPTSDDLREARPDGSALSRLSDRLVLTGVCVVHQLADAELQVRVFVPSGGIGEDPGTGSAAGPIGILARRLWRTPVDLTIRQGAEVGRPCRIDVHAEAGDLRVGGAVAACAEGSFLV